VFFFKKNLNSFFPIYTVPVLIYFDNHKKAELSEICLPQEKIIL